VSAHAEHGNSCMYMTVIRMQLSTTQRQAIEYYTQSLCTTKELQVRLAEAV